MITKDERNAKALLLRSSYAHLLRRMRHKQVTAKEKSMIAMRLVSADINKKQDDSGYSDDKRMMTIQEIFKLASDDGRGSQPDVASLGNYGKTPDA